MALSAMSVTGKICRSSSKLFAPHRSRFGSCAFSTSSRRCGDEDDITALKTNPYFGKYSKKISELQKTMPEEITRRVAAFRNKNVAHQPTDQSIDKDASQATSFTKKKSLNKILKMDSLKDKSPQEITEIWLKHHISLKDTFSVVIPSEVYDLILHTSSRHPTFLLPLPREHGYEFFVSQSCGHEFHFTPLINYQTFKENAPECLALNHFPEFSAEKGLVLIQGEFNSDVLNISEAMCLTNQLHRYYGETHVKRQNMLERFSNAPAEFRHMDLIVELERMVN